MGATIGREPASGGYWDQFQSDRSIAPPTQPSYNINPSLTNGQTPDRQALGNVNVNSGAVPNFTNTSPFAQSNPVMPMGGGAQGGSAGGANTPEAFITQWQATHQANEGIGPLRDALIARFPGVVKPYMYGTTQSNNEVSINGQKFKVISGEDNPATAGWYKAGTDDGGGGPSGGAGGGYGAGGLPPGYTMGDITGGGKYPLSSFDAPGINKPWQTAFTAPDNITEQNDPGYKERLNMGIDSMQRSAAAKGTLLTGGLQKDLNQFSQDYASNEYDKVYGRALGEYNTAYGIYNTNQNNVANRLTSLGNVGLNASS